MRANTLADLFKNKHGCFLETFERAWALFVHGEGMLELYFECRGAVPPNWLTESLHVGVTDVGGCEIKTLNLVWTDVSGSTIRAETKVFPKFARPPFGRSVAPIGDFVLYAGDHERTLPNLFLDTSSEDPEDDDPREDRFP